jgi:hypothetical protein
MQAPSYPPPPPPGEEAPIRPITPRSGNSNPGRLTIPKSATRSTNGSAADLSKSPTATSASRDHSPLPTRRSSLGNLLKRTKSADKMGKKVKKAQVPAAPPLPVTPPRLPELDISKLSNSPMRTFGAAEVVGHQNGSYSVKPSMDIERDNGNLENVRPAFDINQDPYQSTGSITNRGRYSYASSAVSTVHGPRRLRKRKDPTPFK